MRISSKLTTLCRYVLSRDYRDYRHIRILQVFDSDYYRFLLIKNGAEDRELWREGCDDPLWFYFLKSRDERHSLHGCDGQWRQLADPHPLFDSFYYLSRYGKQVGSRNPFAHYLREGWKRGLNPSPLFNTGYYQKQSDWDYSEGDPLTHFTRCSMKAQVSPSPLFDRHWYLEKKIPYPDVVQADIFKHYKKFGAREGKSPHPLFEPAFYLGQCSEANTAGADPLLHYLTSGEAMGCRPNSYFDPVYYRRRYMDAADATSALEHYIKIGKSSGNGISRNAEKLPVQPLISVIVPVFNPELCHLNRCIRSLLDQVYQFWELCLVDDGSSDGRVRESIRSWAEQDRRIRYAFHHANLGISAATQAGADMSRGDYLGFLDNDDELAPDCLYRIAEAAGETGAGVIYTDEDLIGDEGFPLSAFHKPDFNRPLLYSHNYITHFVSVSRELFYRVGGMRSDFDGAQDYDLLLRLSEHLDTFHHIPRVLYHWRATDSSTSINHGNKPYAHEAGRKALADHFRRSGTAAEIMDGSVNYHYRISLKMSSGPSVKVILCSRGQKSAESNLIDWTAAKTAYDNCSFALVGDQPVHSGDSASKADNINRIVAESREEFIAILGYGADDLNNAWLAELVSLLLHNEDTGICCGRVSYAGRDGPSYAEADLTNPSVHYYASFLSSGSRHANGMHNLQWISGCDWQICLLPRSLMETLGGFDSVHFPTYLSMLDLSYRVVNSGKKVLYTPWAVVTYQEENPTSFADDQAALLEKRRFQERHRDLLMGLSAYYNPGNVANSGIDSHTFYAWLSGSRH
ncbi:MAG: glycosyltransferase [Desulfofustis sp.]|nr:glycosyltransferase [Desulfofustis sp.]